MFMLELFTSKIFIYSKLRTWQLSVFKPKYINILQKAYMGLQFDEQTSSQKMFTSIQNRSVAWPSNFIDHKQRIGIYIVFWL